MTCGLKLCNGTPTCTHFCLSCALYTLHVLVCTLYIHAFYILTGVQIVATAQRSELRHVTIQEAGLLDYFINQFVPALQVDKNHHIFSDLLITKSSSTG